MGVAALTDIPKYSQNLGVAVVVTQPMIRKLWFPWTIPQSDKRNRPETCWVES